MNSSQIPNTESGNCFLIHLATKCDLNGYETIYSLRLPHCDYFWFQIYSCV